FDTHRFWKACCSEPSRICKTNARVAHNILLLFFNLRLLNFELGPIDPRDEQIIRSTHVRGQPHIGRNRKLSGGEKQPLMSREIFLLGRLLRRLELTSSRRDFNALPPEQT